MDKYEKLLERKIENSKAEHACTYDTDERRALRFEIDAYRYALSTYIKLKAIWRLEIEMLKFNDVRNSYIFKIKFNKKYGWEDQLTKLDEEILVNEERLALKISFYKVYQLGDPQEIKDLYKETCDLIDKAIEEEERRNAKQNCKFE